MNKIVKRMSTAAATLAVAGGILIAGTGAASASTNVRAGDSIVVTHVGDRQESALRHWDGHRQWYRHSGRGYWYGADHGRKFRYDGHRFWVWSGGKWRPVSKKYALRYALYRFSGYYGGHYYYGGGHGHGHGHHNGR